LRLDRPAAAVFAARHVLTFGEDVEHVVVVCTFAGLAGRGGLVIAVGELRTEGCSGRDV
jgi:hypothetical protein